MPAKGRDFSCNAIVKTRVASRIFKQVDCRFDGDAAVLVKYVRFPMPSGDMAENAGLRRIASLRRNPVIADLFQRLDFMERRGSGFGKILDAYEFESEKRNHEFMPLFSSSRMGFTLTLPNLNYGITINGLRLIGNGNLLEPTQDDSTLKSTLKKTDRTLKESLASRHDFFAQVVFSPTIYRLSI